MTNATKKALWLPKQDADFVLEPVAKALLGLPKDKALNALTESAKRVLRLELDSADIQVAHFELDKDARQVAERLLESVQTAGRKAA